MIMKKIALLLSILLSFALEKGLGFVTINCSTRDGVSCTPRSTVMQIGSINVDNHQESTVNSPTTTKLKGVYRKISPASLAGFVTGIISCVAHSVASDDYEIAELPPPYIPAIFGVVLLGGVGLLTSSLGNVMDEEALLGLQSGARAKKDIERSKSSFFGKRK